MSAFFKQDLILPQKNGFGKPEAVSLGTGQMGMMPRMAAKIMQRMENAQTYMKDALM